jgi:DNA-binding transcriptional LysR family regulator
MDRELLAHLPVAVAVAQDHSFAAAASKLGMSPSAVSHAVRAIEAALGAPLFARTTRSVALTDAGERFLAAVSPALASIDDAAERVAADKGRVTGVLRLNAPRASLPVAITPVVAAMAWRYPDLTIEITQDDGLVDIVAGGFDAGVRLGEMIAEDMVAVRLTASSRLNAGSIDEITRHEQADHRQHQREFGERAEEEPEPGAKTHTCSGLDPSARNHFTDESADEGPDQNSHQSEEDTDHRAYGSTGYRELACADALGAQQSGDEIDDEDEQRQHTQDRERDPSHSLKAIYPRRQQHAAKHERCSGQHRQERADHAHDDQHDSQHPPPDWVHPWGSACQALGTPGTPSEHSSAARSQFAERAAASYVL